MPRIVKEYAVRRSEILDAAQRFIYSKGYEQFTIQDILDELHIAKGLFYYYFPSKQEMLTALLERMIEAIEQLILPMVENTHQTALEKLNQFFITTGRWETDQKPLILGLLRVWYSDDNAFVREKVRMMTVKRLAPYLTTIIHQGIAAGSLTTPSANQSGEIILALIQSLEMTFAETLLLAEPTDEDTQRVLEAVVAYTLALEQMLGAPEHSLQLIDADVVKEWFVLKGSS